MDVSADLTELGRTPIAVVSAGIKSILDIGRTLEYLVCILSKLHNLHKHYNMSTFKYKNVGPKIIRLIFDTSKLSM